MNKAVLMIKKNYAIEGVGLHGKLNLGNGWEAKGEFNKGVGSNDGFSGRNNQNLIMLLNLFSIDS